MDGGKKKDRVSTGVGVEEIFNIDEIVTKEQDAPTEPISDKNTKVINANRYATKKTVAQGMLDIALLTSNTSQLKYVLQVGPKHEFYTLLVVLISISIVLQIISALVSVVLSTVFDINYHPDCPRAEILNNVSTVFQIVSVAVNVIISIFYSIEVDSVRYTVI